jgi:hypothetical protein
MNEKTGTETKPTKRFYWLQARSNKFRFNSDDFSKHFIKLMKRHKKGIYEIAPNYTIVIK